VIRVLPLKGHKSLRVLNAFNSLLLGLKMLPAYMTQDYQTFFASFEDKSDAEKEAALRQAAAFVELSPDEIDAIASFATDANGVPYSHANIKNLGPDELFEIVVAVCMEIVKIKIDLVSSDEKKK
jgi:hypothetical protein